MLANRLQVPARTIMTPGPVEVDPRVLQAMSSSILGQFDPSFTSLMNETMVQLRKVLQTENHWPFQLTAHHELGLRRCCVV